MRTASSLALAGLLVAKAAATCDSNKLTPEKLAADITTGELQNNLWNLNHIGNLNGGNRAFGLPGYKASVDYVLGRVAREDFSSFTTWTQSFVAFFSQTRSLELTGPDGEAVETVAMLYNPGTELPDGVTAPLVSVPVDDERGSGCFEDQYEGIDVEGKIALVRRGVCAVSDKLKVAKAKGALALVMWHQAEGTPTVATLGVENIGLLIPIATVYKAVGEAWVARLAAGEELTVHLVIDAIFEDRETWNVFAETKEGDPNNVVMLGAHLDSVQAGPGINDDGSGTTALLEIATALRRYTGIKNKVRLAWWGAEESGLLGSLHYTETLPAEEADKIRVYFNYDMIGSPFPEFAVYDGSNAGDRVVSQPLFDYLVAAGKPAYYGGFGSSSDYVGFLQLGIPSSGLFTGAGAPTDPCYHLACDTLDNIDWDGLTVNAKAAATVAAKFALDLEGVPPRTKTTVNKRSRNSIRAQFQKWARAKESGVLNKSCSHGEKTTV
ncbi:peptidase-like protein [Microdochium trichocladiopsis]|uniref:Peptide hydrolase n=1 Tax=Microdochium trichocladiopsis TaxID=1682393 RepID=A0A9P8YBW9_9PEZI|nr:peptidase-like protein [Microdochium trichocladiopsis]KAH7035214.1 peptidase-like protein [Microdochium trichocladiopsis]